MYLEGRGGVDGLFGKRYMRTRVMRFDMGETILNQEEVQNDPEIEVQRTVRYSQSWKVALLIILFLKKKKNIEMYICDISVERTL